MSKSSFGDQLKREREMREVSLEEISAATRIGTRFLQAIESEDWEKLPGGVFNRGFVRAVSRFLGLDEEAMLAEYDLARLQSAPPGPQVPPQPMPRPFARALPILIILLLAAIVAGGIYAWRHFAFLHRARPAPSASAPSPSSSGSQQSASLFASSAAAASLDLSVAAGITTQVRVIADGAILYDGTFAAGETRHFQAHDQFDISAADSAGVLLELNGQSMLPLGIPGAPGKISLTRKDLKRTLRGPD